MSVDTVNQQVTLYGKDLFAQADQALDQSTSMSSKGWSRGLRRHRSKRRCTEPADVTMLTLVILAALAITVGSTRAAVLAEERSAAPPPGLGAVAVTAAATESEPQTDRARVAPMGCPYHFGSDMPPATFCVYQGVAFGSGGEECAAGVVVIWSSSTPSRVSIEPAEKASGSNREVHLGFVADPELVLRAIVDAPQSDRAELIEYTLGSADAPQPLAGRMTLQPMRVGANTTVDVLHVELRGPQRFRPGGCAFASYSGTFLGVIQPPRETETYVDAAVAPAR